MKTSRLLLCLVTAATVIAGAGPALAQNRADFFYDGGDGPHHGIPTPISMNLTGSGKAAHNVTYAVTITAHGRGMEPMTAAGQDSSVALRGTVLAHIQATSSNGVNHTGNVFLLLYLHDENGTWKWFALSHAHTDAGLPRLGLRGTATEGAAGSFTLSGEGRAMRAEDGGGAPVVLALTGNLQERSPTPYAVSLSGSGTHGNTTYTFTLTGDGNTVVAAKNGTTARIEGWYRVHVVVTSGNATVKDRQFWVHLSAVHLDGGGKWILYSAAERANDVPRILLHGNATAGASGITLDGRGSAVFWNDDHAVPMKLTVTGSLAPKA
ncbi:MAG: hypothetical protein ACYDBQ_12425 [Thermoplasmatota archaeon]